MASMRLDVYKILMGLEPFCFLESDWSVMCVILCD